MSYESVICTPNRFNLTACHSSGRKKKRKRFLTLLLITCNTDCTGPNCLARKVLCLSVSSDSYCTSEIVGSRVMVTHFLPYILTIPLCGQWTIQCSEPGCWLCFSLGYYTTWLWIRLSILSCGAFPQGFCRSLIFSLPTGGEIMWQLFFESLNRFYCLMRLNKVSHPAGLFKRIPIDSNLPVKCWHPWSFIVALTAPKASNFDLIWKGPRDSASVYCSLFAQYLWPQLLCHAKKVFG